MSVVVIGQRAVALVVGEGLLVEIDGVGDDTLGRRVCETTVEHGREGQRLHHRGGLVGPGDGTVVRCRHDRAGVVAADRRHRQDLAGRGFGDDHDAAFGVLGLDGRGEAALDLELQGPVDGEAQVRPLVGRFDDAFAVGNGPAVDRAFRQHGAGLTRQRLVVLLLDAADADLVDVGRAEHAAGQGAVGPESGGFLGDGDPGHVLHGLDRSGGLGVARALEVAELAVAAQDLGDLGGIATEHRREGLGLGDGIDHQPRVDPDHRVGHRHRQRLAVAVDEIAAVAGQGHRPRPLLLTLGDVAVAFEHLDSHHLGDEGTGDDHERQNHDGDPSSGVVRDRPRPTLPRGHQRPSVDAVAPVPSGMSEVSEAPPPSAGATAAIGASMSAMACAGKGSR